MTWREDTTDESANDADAIHASIPDEFIALIEKSAPVPDDVLLIEDSEDSGEKKYLLLGNLPSGGVSVAILEDQKAQNTAGGTFTTGADQDRVLNTIASDPDGIIDSLAGNAFTLSDALFLIEWEAPAIGVNFHQSMLYDAVGAAILHRGQSAYAPGASVIQNVSSGAWLLNIVGSKDLKIKHRCSTTVSDYGFGQACNFGMEIYTRVKITKL